MEQIKMRNQIPDEFKWDRSLLVENKKEYEAKKVEGEKLLQTIIGLKNHILDSAASLLNYLETQIKLEQIVSDIYVWANLYKYEDLNNNEANDLSLNVEDYNHKISVETAFVIPEILKGNIEQIKGYIEEEPKLKEYEHLLNTIFKDKEHVLNEECEKLIKTLTHSYGKSSDIHEILSDAESDLGKIEIDNKSIKITQSNFISLLKNKKSINREKVFKTYFKFYQKHKNTLASLYCCNILEDNALANVRKFKNSLRMALNNENIGEEVYQNLLSSVNENFNTIFEYQKLRKKLLNLEEYHIYDNYLELDYEEKEEYSIEKCQNILREALKPLKEDYLKKLEFMFSKQYIVYYPNEGKRSGAFQWRRFVMLNHINTFESLETMAHELGHAMNTLYTEEKQPLQYQNNPIFLAEIASTLNEVLLNDYLYNKAKSKEEKIKELCNFLSRVQATIYRQTMFAEFEYIIHEKEREGISLTEEVMSNTYYDLVKKYFTKEIILDEEIKYEWMRIPHFYSSFYVYKYAIGLICALIFAKRILNGERNAVDNYLKFLSSGDCNYPLEILKNANIDLTKKAVFNEAFDLINKKVQELKEVIQSE